MTPLLAWQQKSGRAYALLGSTFSSRMEGSDQWFNKLALQACGLGLGLWLGLGLGFGEP